MHFVFSCTRKRVSARRRVGSSSTELSISKIDTSLLTIIFSYVSRQSWHLSGILGRVSRQFRTAANACAPRCYEAPDSKLLQDFMLVLENDTYENDTYMGGFPEAGTEVVLDIFSRDNSAFAGAKIISAIMADSELCHLRDLNIFETPEDMIPEIYKQEIEEQEFLSFAAVHINLELPFDPGSKLTAIDCVHAVDEELKTIRLLWQPLQAAPDCYIERMCPEFFTQSGAGWLLHANIMHVGRSSVVAQATVIITSTSDGQYTRKDSPKLSVAWDCHSNGCVREGVSWCDSLVEPCLVESLQEQINMLASLEPPDYHPNSGDIVRDHVHPALYPYIHGTTQTTSLPSKVAPVPAEIPTGVQQSGGESIAKDMWGRTYEDSKYQWLPAQFVHNSVIALLNASPLIYPTDIDDSGC